MEKQSRNLIVILGLFMSSSAWATEPKNVTFLNATPTSPIEIVAVEYKPPGFGPFPAVVLMHGCHGVTPTIHRWARWLQERGYVALVMDSWKPRKISNFCNPDSPEVATTERCNDAVGALKYLHSHTYIDRDRIGVMGWSNGGVYSMALVNEPSLERAIKREVPMPAPGFRASVGIYPGGCHSLLEEKFVYPVLLLLGDADDWTTPSPCIKMTKKMREKVQYYIG